MTGYDFNGVVDTGNYRPTSEDVIITGNTFSMVPSVLDWLLAHEIKCAVYFMPRPGWANNNVAAGIWKAEMIMRIRVTRFYEDNPEQAEIIGSLCPECEVIRV